MKAEQKKIAIRLRTQGKSYNEILGVIPVSKSTLSMWLREVSLTKRQTHRLTAKKYAAQKKGGAKRRTMRLEETEIIFKKCKKDIKSISDRELFLIGIVLYWAEGSKPKENRPSVLIDFANSDPHMLKLFTVWLLKFGKVSKSDISLRLHVHENHRAHEMKLKRQWSGMLGIPLSQFIRTNFKKHNPKTNRSKISSDYIGLVSVRVKKSTALNRSIMGWICAIIATQK